MGENTISAANNHTYAVDRQGFNRVDHADRHGAAQKAKNRREQGSSQGQLRQQRADKKHAVPNRHDRQYARDQRQHAIKLSRRPDIDKSIFRVFLSQLAVTFVRAHR